MKRNFTLFWCTFSRQFWQTRNQRNFSVLFCFIFKKKEISLSFWYFSLIHFIKDEGRLNVSPKPIFIFVTLLSTNFFITNYLRLGRYPKTWTPKERSKFSNVRVFLNFWVIYFDRKSQLLRVLTWMKFMCS